jgi:hypothetical protein
MTTITETPPNREGKTRIAPPTISQPLGMKPRVYLPGDMDMLDRRHPLVPGLNRLEWQHHYIERPTFTYVGPFYVPGRHLCSHSTWKRGIPCPHYSDCELGDTDLEMADKNRRGLAKADLVMALISGPISTQTMNDLDFAFAQNKRVVLSITEGASQMDISDICARAHRVHQTYDLDRLKSDFEFEVCEILGALLYGVA